MFCFRSCSDLVLFATNLSMLCFSFHKLTSSLTVRPYTFIYVHCAVVIFSYFYDFADYQYLLIHQPYKVRSCIFTSHHVSFLSASLWMEIRCHAVPFDLTFSKPFFYYAMLLHATSMLHLAISFSTCNLTPILIPLYCSFPFPYIRPLPCKLYIKMSGYANSPANRFHRCIISTLWQVQRIQLKKEKW